MTELSKLMKRKIKSYLREKGFLKNHSEDFFHLDPHYFPESTKNLFSTDFIVKNGMLPLGFKTVYKMFRKKKILNLGMLHPEKKEILKEVESICKENLADQSFGGVKIYLIERSEFMEILKTVYHLPITF